jgi:pyridoxal phosphate enzyme (YggS family)
MNDVQRNLDAVRHAMAAACVAAGRAPDSVGLVAVSKQQPASAVMAALAAGQRAFGENYPQEGVAKIAAVADPRAEWHFIGQLQSNKTRLVAEHFDWVHGIDRLAVAERLARQRPAARGPLRCCIQVDLSDEPGKGGVPPAGLAALARAVAALPNLELRGLMVIPAPSTEPAAQRQRFRRLRELAEDLRGQGLALDTLSMGMSADFPAAIAEGATLVRIGSAVFGSRSP